MFVIDRTTYDQDTIVLACDGVWDVYENMDVAAYVNQMQRMGCNDPKSMSRSIVNFAYGKYSRDNLSCLIVNLNQHVDTIGCQRVVE